LQKFGSQKFGLAWVWIAQAWSASGLFGSDHACPLSRRIPASNRLCHTPIDHAIGFQLAAAVKRCCPSAAPALSGCLQHLGITIGCCGKRSFRLASTIRPASVPIQAGRSGPAKALAWGPGGRDDGLLVDPGVPAAGSSFFGEWGGARASEQLPAGKQETVRQANSSSGHSLGGVISLQQQPFFDDLLATAKVLG
jgi:hypothetical protein